MRAPFTVAVVAIASTVARLALADPPTEVERALAQSLFEEGRALMDEGRYAEACERFARSQKLDAGGGTLLNLAVCHEKEGKVSTAYVEYGEALALALRDGRKDREDLARARAAALAPILPRVRFSAPSAPPGLVVSLDGETVPPDALAQDGTPVPTDPGTHVVEARATDREPVRMHVSVPAGGGVVDVRIPPLPAARGAVAESPPPRRSSSRKTVGFAVGGAGVAAIAAGVVFGLDALSKQHSADDRCPEASCSDPEAVSLSKRAVTSAWISDVAIGVGIVAVGVGVYLVATQSSSSRARASWRGVEIRF